MSFFSVVFLDFLMVPATSRPQIDILLICQGPMAKTTALESPKPVSPGTDDKDRFHGWLQPLFHAGRTTKTIQKQFLRIAPTPVSRRTEHTKRHGDRANPLFHSGPIEKNTPQNSSE